LVFSQIMHNPIIGRFMNTINKVFHYEFKD
jgi:hypothetical protein